MSPPNDPTADKLDDDKLADDKIDDYELEAPVERTEEARLSESYLEAARKDEKALEQIATAPRAKLPVAPFSERIWEIVRSEGYAVRWLGISAGISVVGFILSAGVRMSGGIGGGSMATGLGAIAGVLGMMVGAVGVVVMIALLGATGFALLAASANGLDRVAEWPKGGPAEWLAEGFSLLLALFAASFPGWLLSKLVGGGGIPLLALSAIALLPWIILSQLHNGSVWGIVAPDVGRQAKLARAHLGPFYARTLPLGLVIAVALTGGIVLGPLAALLAGPVIATAALACFRLLGRLAWVLDELDEKV